MPRASSLTAAITSSALLFALSTGCAHPHRTPKLVGGIGAVLAGVGGATWAVGDRAHSESVAGIGLGTAALGVVTLLVAGGLMASSVACRADADCPVGEECREVPAPPGGVPYAQCVPR